MNDTPDEPQDHDPTVPDTQGGRLFRTVVGDEWVTMPATIAGIRAALPKEQRAEFTEAIENTPARDMFATMVRWARPPEMVEAVERDHDRIQRLAEEADARVIMGEDPDVVRRALRSQIAKGAGPTRP
ncbi:hypothetical protein [Embleya sp. NPDC059237]|uniref:hypothetical protein n=1 Tax=Embleya sp. NPDC059237 TaxID=3346784 RepID=UPI0036CE7A40